MQKIVEKFKLDLAFVSKKIINTSCLLWGGVLVFLVTYHFWGASFISDVYHERSFSFLNELLQGRDSHSLGFYCAKADRLVYGTIGFIFALSLVPYIYIYARNLRSPIPRVGGIDTVSLPTAAVGFSLALSVSIVPLIFVTHPPLLDYPFHIARAYILDNWNESPLLQSWYSIESFIIPNMGMDLTVLLLTKLFPIEVAGRVFIALTFGITLSGCMFLYRMLYGHLSLWPLISSLLLFNEILLLGFMNYLLGVALLLWAVGFWVWISRFGPLLRLLCGTLAATTLFVAHLVALGLYMIVVAGYELNRGITTFRLDKRAAGVDLIVGASTFLAPLVLFLISSTSGETSATISYRQPFLWKKVTYVGTLLSKHWPVDIALLVVITFLVCIVIFHGRLQLAKSMYLPLILLILSFFLLPWGALSAGYIDQRIPVAILFFAIGCTKLELRSKTWHRTVLIGLAAFLMLRSVVLSYAWHRQDQVIQEFTNAFCNLPFNSVLFVLSEKPSYHKMLGEETPVWHLGSLATIEQRIFVPAIFAHPSQHPITVKDKYSLLKEFHQNNPIYVKTSEELGALVESIGRVTSYVGLEANSVYMLVLDPKHPPPNHTKVVASGSRFLLLEAS
jgi:hypothetical protein